MSHVFVSYARADREKVGRYVERLEAEGFVVRWDKNLKGQRFNAQLKQWIEEAAAFVIFWSSASIQSDFVEAELNYADIEKVVSVSVDPIDARSIPLKANTLDIIDLSVDGTDRNEEGISKLVARCGELMGRTARPRDVEGDPSERASVDLSESPRPTSITVNENKGGVVAGNITGPVKIDR